MLSSLRTWRGLLVLIAIGIVIVSVVLSNFLARKIAVEEKRKIEQWVEAVKEVNSLSTTGGILSGKVLSENNKDIPIIAVTESATVLDHYNIDTAKVAADSNYIYNRLRALKKENAPIIWKNPLDSTQNNLVYYGESPLLKQIRYFPLVQLVVVSIFILLLFYSISTRNKSTQNQVWAGMAKETAHQLGTPLSSLQGWVELLGEEEGHKQISDEMRKDVDRLKLVSDRFGKIGSKPQLEEKVIYPLVAEMIEYIKRRASERVTFSLSGEEDIIAMINPPLFDWVIENLLKNALDAMDGKGSIAVEIREEATNVIIDVKDTGKGISKKNAGQVFNPGFTTKQRGWGLGLSLSKRIVEQYHKGELFVKNSEQGKGTTFRIVLRK